MQSREQVEPTPVASRRRALRDLGLAVGGLTIGTAVLPLRSLLPAAAAQGEEPAEEEAPVEAEGLSEPELLALLASLELAAAEGYRTATRSGLATAAGPALAAFAQHHTEHADRLAALAGSRAKVNPKLHQVLQDQLGQAEDGEGILARLEQLETSLAATHLTALGTLGTKPAEGAEGPGPVAGAAAAVASILPVESQHAVVLGGSRNRPLDERAPAFEIVDNALPSDFYAAADEEASS